MTEKLACGSNSPYLCTRKPTIKPIVLDIHRGVEQLVARQAHNLEVARSSRTSATNTKECMPKSICSLFFLGTRDSFLGTRDSFLGTRDKFLGIRDKFLGARDKKKVASFVAKSTRLATFFFREQWSGIRSFCKWLYLRNTK